MEAPLVSIIMNCYNNADTLQEALQSVFAQTFKNYEIILWDNGSSDESINIAQNFNSKCLHIFNDPERISLGHARNNALAVAKGEYIAFLDCDDYWLPTKLAKQVKLMQENKNVALVCTNTENFCTHKVNNKYIALGNFFKITSPHRGKAFAKLIAGQWISMSSALLRRKHLESLGRKDNTYFDVTLNICEEAELFYALAYDFDIDYIDEVLTKRRMHASNTTFTRFAQLSIETEYILARQYILHPNFSNQYPDIVTLLTQRAKFQQSIALWCEGHGQKARKALQKLKNPPLKHKLFYVLSFMPPSTFPYAMRIYLKLAKYLNGS